MTAEAQRITAAPIHKILRVSVPPERAFQIFAGAMGRWWLKSHSLLRSPQVDVVIEPRAGGRWYEIGEDGSEQDWGKVVAWEPPHRLLLDWQLTGEWTYDRDFHTSIEVRFSPDGDGTLVVFEHRDLDRYGEKADEQRAGMDGGWSELLNGFDQLTSGNAEGRSQ